MIDWDDVRYFLGVARGGSVRAAAERLGVNHATVLRRVAQLEERLGARLFDRLPSGYRMTAAGEEVLGLAEQMEASSSQLEARVLGRDQGVRGLLRVTMAPTIATHLLMPDLAEFAQAHPDVELSVLSLDELVNLTNREAEVAIRVVYDRMTLPPNLHGLKGPELFGGVYLSRDLLAAWRTGKADRVRWIVKDNVGLPDWAHQGDVPAAEVPFRTTNADAQIVAVRQGLGMTTLPCFVGDADPLLARVPGTGLQDARHALAAHAGRDAQDEARAALHRVHVRTADDLRAVTRGTDLFPRLTRALFRGGRVSGASAHNRCEEVMSPA